MRYRPPKGVRPPQLEGKRTGRPKGARNWAKAWRDCVWGFKHADWREIAPPTPGAALWRAFAADNGGDLYDFLVEHGVFRE